MHENVFGSQTPPQQSLSLLQELPTFGLQQVPLVQIPPQQSPFALQLLPFGLQHTPLVQTTPFAQPCPHVPQLLGSLPVLVQVPLQLS